MKGIFQALLAVTSAMFGVRSSKGFEEDKKLPLLYIFLIAFLMVGVFIGTLIFIIKFIVLA
jgi:Protein of unknown function (DUF2970)